MDNILKRAMWPSFFILPALLFALLISSVEGFVFWWAGLACLIFAIIIRLPRTFNWSPLSIAVIVYIAFLVFNIFISSPSFTAKGLYFLCYFTAGFLVFSCLNKEQTEFVFKLTTGLFLLLAVWAIFQYITGQGYLTRAWPRVNAIFFTPNTFAAAINLILLPLTAVFLFSPDKRAVFFCMLFLFIVLLLTQSRGGMLAFLSGLVVIWITGRASKEYQADGKSWLKLIAGLIIVFCIFSIGELARKSGKYASIIEGLAGVSRLTNEIKSGTERLKIYDIAWQRIKEKPFLGYGYNHFQYYQLSDQPLSRKGITTQFVHNDYLQIWMETGIIGLLLLLTIMVLFYLTLFRYIKSSGQYVTLAVALLAGMTAYFTHAMVDFVMYPPVLLLMFGAYLGITNSLLAGDGYRMQLFNPGRMEKRGLRFSVIRAVAGVFLAAWLSQPAIAQLAFDKAMRDVNRLDII
jgi:O-antigen ligase